MRSLVARIFLAIVLTNVLVSVAIGIVLDASFERRRSEHAETSRIVARTEGASALALLRADRPDDARAVLADTEARTGVRLVARLDTRTFSASALDDEATRAVQSVLDLATESPTRDARIDDWVSVSLPEQGGVIAASYGRPRSPFWLSPPRLQFLLVLVCAAVMSFLLARGLSAPIRALRGAAARVSAGDLTVRVTPSLSRHADAEVSALARDFDAMTQKVSELVSSRERLLRDVSHELRSPLARLSMALEVARQSTPPEAHAALDRIGRESERLEELVALVLTMARLDDASVAERTEILRLDEIVADVVGDADYEARTTGRTLVAGPLPHITLRGNAELLRQAIENVVRNALRFAPEGTALELALESREADAHFVVRDHGPGVPDDKLDDIFRPFARLSSARERETGGAGLGLAIAERAVRVHAGRVRATNAEGGGLRVEIVLPLRA